MAKPLFRTVSSERAALDRLRKSLIEIGVMYKEDTFGDPTRDIAAAMVIIGRLYTRRVYMVALSNIGDDLMWECRLFAAETRGNGRGRAHSAPEAICRAAYNLLKPGVTEN